MRPPMSVSTPLCSLALCFLLVTCRAPGLGEGYLLAYFEDRGDDRTHIRVRTSQDGVTWNGTSLPGLPGASTENWDLLGAAADPAGLVRCVCLVNKISVHLWEGIGNTWHSVGTSIGYIPDYHYDPTECLTVAYAGGVLRWAGTDYSLSWLYASARDACLGIVGKTTEDVVGGPFGFTDADPSDPNVRNTDVGGWADSTSIASFVPEWSRVSSPEGQKRRIVVAALVV